MKRALYGIMAFVLLLSGCTVEEEIIDEGREGANVAVRFTVDIPEPTAPETRAINENQIDNIYLLVFDESGRFLSRTQASLNGTAFTATLTQSSSKRIVHFIANYDWSGFSDAAALTKDEGEVVGSLKTTALVFWQRSVLTNGISAGVFASQPISLIRNMAKFTLSNTAVGLTNVTFAVFNKASIGSVAPFNDNTNLFDPAAITEPAGVTFTGTDAMGVDPVYGFERKNSTATTNPTYVIIQGTFNGLVNYYKIDLVDASHNVYDIKRNTWFQILVQSVTLAGYATLAQAQSSPASNNIAASVLIQSYPSISDGAFTLSVDRTTISFTTNGQTLNATANYKTVGGVSQNNLLTVTLVQDPVNPVINGGVSYNAATGALTANINNVPANGAANMATIKLAAGNLSRTIQLMLHAPFQFDKISITPSVLVNAVGTAAMLKFTIPPEALYLLPFDTYITSAYLTPTFGNIEVIHEGGLYKYKWKVTVVGEQSISFNTNTATAAETVFIEANLFNRGQVSYTNTGGTYRFSNVVLTPNPVGFGIGQAVTLRFTVPTAGTYTIRTNNLTPVSGSVIGGVYTYTTNTVGEQVVAFTTNKANSAETLTIVSANYTTYPVILRNSLVHLFGTLTYGTSSVNLPINIGTVSITNGGQVIDIIQTSATGVYDAKLTAKIGDVLTFSCTIASKIYTATVPVTDAEMPWSFKLAR